VTSVRPGAGSLAKGLFDCSIEPIRNPVTGKTYRAAIQLHDGFEFKGAEIGSATFRGEASYACSMRTAMGS
jgi:hypothetical protein